MTIAHIITLLVTGIGVGFLSGLLGIGGGFIMTPVQYIVYTAMGVPADTAIKLSFGTSLLVILPTAISGAWRHNKKKAVWWKAGAIMGSCSLLAAFSGASLATHLPGAVLKAAFGIVALVVGVRMLTARPPRIGLEPKKNPWLMFAWAIPIGLISGTLGVGGGILAIPILTIALRFSMHGAVATSLAIMVLGSVGGVIGYIINGLGISGLPAHSLGYIHWPTWLILTVASTSMAQIGAVTAHRLPARQLRFIFIAINSLHRF